MKLSSLNKVNISCTRGMFIYFALLLLLISLRLLVAVVISAVIHELFHIVATRLVGKKVYSVRIGPRGTIIQTQPLDDKEEMFCALAGPMSGFLLLLLFRWLPVIALAGIVHSLYNLLPLNSTDGGRILRCGAKLMFPITIADGIVYWAEVITLSAVMAFCVYASIWLRLGIIPIVFALALLLRSAKRK